jgi:hypothetical protein
LGFQRDWKNLAAIEPGPVPTALELYPLALAKGISLFWKETPKKSPSVTTRHIAHCRICNKISATANRQSTNFNFGPTKADKVSTESFWSV